MEYQRVQFKTEIKSWRFFDDFLTISISKFFFVNLEGKKLLAVLNIEEVESVSRVATF